MNKLYKSISAGFVGMILMGMPMLVHAGEQPNILIMGVDVDIDAVSRKNRVFKRVLNALVNEMNDKGFNVYDDAITTLGYFSQDRIQRTDVDMIDIARSVKRPPIDVAVLFSIYVSSNKISYTTKIRTRVTGRLLNVKSGKRLGNFEVELPQLDNAPVQCNRECILETVGNNARVLGMDLGAVLAKKLEGIAPGLPRGIATGNENSGLSSAYTMVFRGFTPDEIIAVEKYIIAFKGYEHHRPVSQSLRTNEYWYETSSKAARLSRNLRLMLNHVGAEGRIAVRGNTFEVDKITQRKTR